MSDLHDKLLSPVSGEERKAIKTFPFNLGFLLLFTAFFNRAAQFSITSILKPFLETQLSYSNSLSTAFLAAFNTLMYLFPVIGAIIADSYWGKYKTLVRFGLLYLFGTILLGIFSHPNFFNETMILLSLFIFITLGFGGIQPLLSTFGGDQFNKRLEGKSFSWFMELMIVFLQGGTVLSYCGVSDLPINGLPPYIDISHGYFAVFTLCGIFALLSYVIFIVGSNSYVKLPHSPSKVQYIFKTLWITARETLEGRLVLLALLCTFLIILMTLMNTFMIQFKLFIQISNYVAASLFLFTFIILVNINDSSYIEKGYQKLMEREEVNRQHSFENVIESNRTKGIIDDIQHVKDTYIFVRIFPFMIFQPFFWLVYFQSLTNLYSVTCQTNLALSNGEQLNANYLTAATPLVIIIFAPFMKSYGNDWIERIKGSPFTVLDKTLCGLFLGIFSMLASGWIELARKASPLLDTSNLNNYSRCGLNSLMSDFNAAWLLIPYICIGSGGYFVQGPLYNFLYSEVPDTLVVTSQCLYNYSLAVGSSLNGILVLSFSTFITNNINQGHLEYLFFFIAGLLFIISFIYIQAMKKFKFKSEIQIPLCFSSKYEQ